MIQMLGLGLFNRGQTHNGKNLNTIVGRQPNFEYLYRKSELPRGGELVESIPWQLNTRNKLNISGKVNWWREHPPGPGRTYEAVRV